MLFIPSLYFPFLNLIHSIADVFLSLNGVVIPNHGYVNISDIGTDDAALLCHTTHPGIHESEGNWSAPDGTKIFVNGVPGFNRSRGPMVVRLNKISGTGQPEEGIYKCSIKEDEDAAPQDIYVGLYHTAGNYVQINSTTFTIQSLADNLANLITLIVMYRAHHGARLTVSS